MAQDNKEGMSSEPVYTVTPGGIMTGPVQFQSLNGNPPEPKMRGDAKPVGSHGFPASRKQSGAGGALGAFGFGGKKK